jgi:hypothetical protein
MLSRARVSFSPSRVPDSRRFDQPTMALRGVRSSCDSVARNSSLIRLACSAAARASRSRSRRISRSASASRAARRSAARSRAARNAIGSRKEWRELFRM